MFSQLKNASRLRALPRMATFIATMLVVGACGKSSSNSPRPVPFPNTKQPEELPQKFFVHGNVDRLLADTETSGASIFSIEDLKRFDDFNLASFVSFAEKIDSDLVDKIEDQDDLENENSGNSGNSDDPSGNLEDQFRFEKVGNEYIYQSSEAPLFRLHFNPTAQGKLELTKIQLSASRRIDVKKVHHYSLKDDGNAFSILYETEQSDEGRSLEAIYFYKTGVGEGLFYPTREDYAYLLGRSFAIGWSQSFDLDLCGSKAIAKADLIEESLLEWDFAQTKDRIGYLPYNIRKIESPAPFNDLNQNCLYFTEGYRFEDQENTVVFGLALPIINYSLVEFIGGFIMIAEDAHDPANGIGNLRTTLIHEIGHLLGLGHEFKRDSSGKSVHSSVMGYEGVPSVTRRDREAINELYKAYQRKYLDREYAEISRTVDEISSSEATSLSLVNLVVHKERDGLDKVLIELKNEGDRTICDLNLEIDFNLDTGSIYPANAVRKLIRSSLSEEGFVNDCLLPQDSSYWEFENQYVAVELDNIITTSIKISSEVANEGTFQPAFALNQLQLNSVRESSFFAVTGAFEVLTSQALEIRDVGSLAVFDKDGVFTDLVEPNEAPLDSVSTGLQDLDWEVFFDKKAGPETAIWFPNLSLSEPEGSI